MTVDLQRQQITEPQQPYGDVVARRTAYLAAHPRCELSRQAGELRVLCPQVATHRLVWDGGETLVCAECADGARHAVSGLRIVALDS